MRVAEVEIGSVGVFLAAAAIWIDGRWSGRRLSVVGPSRSGTGSGLGCFFLLLVGFGARWWCGGG
jgi:hypothetical protein